ncbi:hypothetical protein [Microbulbifer elongatus]|uniref:aldose epimerase family protein n=1 Tax=Microbulbifer elongatus TaxID=86173 RepID=UPI001CFE4877|nr:hypothetical protein [Microbulbifer elongatus]
MTKSKATIEPIDIEGFPAFRIQNPHLSLDIVPELGGKIISLRSGPALQTEWLWKNDRIAYQVAELGHSYTLLHDTGGVDECFPSVDSCELPQSAGEWSGLTLPDHGELYSRPWTQQEYEITDNGSATLKLKHHCTTMPVVFERRLTVSPDRGEIRFEYGVQNRSDKAVPFSWCMHPALAIAPGMKLRLPHNHQLHCSYASDNAPLVTGDLFHWPLALNGADMSVIPDLDAHRNSDCGFAAKLLSNTDLFDCTSGNTPAVAGLENPATGEALHFLLPPAEVPHIALWLNYHGWSGDEGAPYFNLIIEPAVGNGDSLDTLIRRRASPLIPSLSSRAWSFNIHIRTTKA